MRGTSNYDNHPCTLTLQKLSGQTLKHFPSSQMNQVYNELLMKQKQNEVLVQQGRKRYEYDSDEDTEVSRLKVPIQD